MNIELENEEKVTIYHKRSKFKKEIRVNWAGELEERALPFDAK